MVPSWTPPEPAIEPEAICRPPPPDVSVTDRTETPAAEVIAPPAVRVKVPLGAVIGALMAPFPPAASVRDVTVVQLRAALMVMFPLADWLTLAPPLSVPSMVAAAVLSISRSVGSSSQEPPRPASTLASPMFRAWPEVSTEPPPFGPPARITAPSAMVVVSDRLVWGAVTPTSTWPP